MKFNVLERNVRFNGILSVLFAVVNFIRKVHHALNDLICIRLLNILPYRDTWEKRWWKLYMVKGPIQRKYGTLRDMLRLNKNEFTVVLILFDD